MVEDRDQHGRHSVKRRTTFISHRLKCHPRIISLSGVDHRSPARHGCKITQDHAEAMIERNRNADAVLDGEIDGLSRKITIVENVAMRKRCPLWKTRRAAGELYVDGIVRSQTFRCRAQQQGPKWLVSLSQRLQ